MDCKLIFLDIDGTIVAPGTHAPSDKVMEAVHDAQKNGHRVFLCTGRNLSLTRPILDKGFDGSVCSAGTYVFYRDDVIVNNPMTAAQRDLILEVTRRTGIACMLETIDAAYAEDGALNPLEKTPDNSEAQRLKRLQFLPFEAYDGKPVYTVPFVCPPEGDFDTAKKELENDFNFCIYTPDTAFGKNSVNGELFIKGFNKATGIIRICERLGVPAEDTIGFGDSMNDYEMMSAVGTSVCMENGCDEIKAISNMICPPVEKDGLVEGFKMLGLI